MQSTPGVTTIPDRIKTILDLIATIHYHFGIHPVTNNNPIITKSSLIPIINPITQPDHPHQSHSPLSSYKPISYHPQVHLTVLYMWYTYLYMFYTCNMHKIFIPYKPIIPGS